MLRFCFVGALVFYSCRICFAGICETPSSYAEASSCCKSSLLSLPVTSTLQDNKHLKWKLAQTNKATTWLGIEKNEFESWMWLDQTKLENSDMGNHGGCAFYNFSSGKYNGTNCGARNLGHICEKKDCKSCFSTGIHRHMCQKAGVYCFTLHCEGKNWYKAAEDCRSWNATLTFAKKTLNLNISSDGCKHYWVGLHREDWKWNNGQSISANGTSFWTENETTQNGNCVVFSASQQEFKWHTADCNSKFPFICNQRFEGSTQKHDIYGSMNTSPLTVITAITTVHIKPSAALIVSIPVVIIVAAVILSVLIVWKYRKHRREHSGGNKEEMLQLNKEEEPNATMDTPYTEEALQIIKFDKKTSHLSVLQHNLRRVLTKDDTNQSNSPLVVLSIAGPFRMGKSFLMNFIIRYLRALEGGIEDKWLSDKEQELKGFPWKSGTEVTTLGIWMWSRPFHITYKSGRRVSVLLIDTQGIFDEPNQSEAATMVTLSSLVSSMQIYNMMETFSFEDMDHLTLTLTSSQMLKELANEDIVGPFIKRFILLIRDKEFKDAAQGYWEGGEAFLKKFFKDASRDDIDEEDRTRYDCILSGIGSLQCFLMPSPGRSSDGEHFKGCLKEISQEFQKGLEEMAKKLFDEENIVELKSSGHIINGNQLLQRFFKFASFFNTGRMAKPEYTVEALTEEMNTLELKQAIGSFYREISLMSEEITGREFLKGIETLGNKLYRHHEMRFLGSDAQKEKCKDALREIVCLSTAEHIKTSQARQEKSEKEDLMCSIRSRYLKRMASFIAEGVDGEGMEEAHQSQVNMILQSIPESERTQEKIEMLNSLFSALNSTINPVK